MCLEAHNVPSFRQSKQCNKVGFCWIGVQSCFQPRAERQVQTTAQSTAHVHLDRKCDARQILALQVQSLGESSQKGA